MPAKTAVGGASTTCAPGPPDAATPTMRARSPKRSAVFGALDNSDAMRQALTQCPVLLTRHRKSAGALRCEEASRTSCAASPTAASNCAGRAWTPLREPRSSPLSRTFPSRARSASPSGCSEAFSHFFAEPRSPKRASSPEERNTKLRGAGHANYQRNISSPGIPWRQIPNLDRSSSAFEPREGECAERLRKVGQFSPTLGSGDGMREILTASADGSLFRTPPPSEVQKEAVTDMAKRRSDGKLSPPAGGRFVRLDFDENGGKDAGGAEKSSLHFAYKQMRKGVNHELVTMKESCPYARQDAPVAQEGSLDRSCSPKRRGANALQANLAGAGAVLTTQVEGDTKSLVPEKVTESRRDWQVESRRDWQAQVPNVRKSLPARPQAAAFNGFSPNLSPLTVLAIEKPIHSIRQRSTLPGSKLWK
uniref:Uncharacterized protein n=1 Tax=Alexandrium catenella TaxID=2925 RepID=A0A7S1S526_ALECA|mmetsp:Transcript_86610/g.230056  ORF Transcript_86610/g.230056 Transcript_86610/m.230056 type:complete len:421 (+) Transcript_86610:62-1324(+)